jgi:hypothetical protein
MLKIKEEYLDTYIMANNGHKILCRFIESDLYNFYYKYIPHIFVEPILEPFIPVDVPVNGDIIKEIEDNDLLK